MPALPAGFRHSRLVRSAHYATVDRTGQRMFTGGAVVEAAMASGKRDIRNRIPNPESRTPNPESRVPI